MKRIGITGGIGSGKSTFSRMLAERGAVYFDADREANIIMEANTGVREQLVRLLGPDTYNADGSLNKKHVAQVVFSDETKLARIGAIVHPLVEQAFEKRAAIAEKEGAVAIIREAALLPREATRSALDLLIVVAADPEIRIERVMKRSRLHREDVTARMKAQASDEAFLKAADRVIWNNGSQLELIREADDFWKEEVAQ